MSSKNSEKTIECLVWWMIIAAKALLLMFGWNYFMTDFWHLRTITYGEAFCLRFVIGVCLPVTFAIKEQKS